MGVEGRVQGDGGGVQQGLKGTYTPSSPAPGLGRGAAASLSTRCSLHSVSRERRPLGGT